MEDSFQEGQDKEEEQDKGNIKAEDNAIEMSEDFDGQMHDGEEQEPGNVGGREAVSQLRIHHTSSSLDFRSWKRDFSPFLPCR